MSAVRIRHTARGHRGTTTVEFAVVGVVLLLELFVIIEFGRLLFTYSVLNEGARRASRLAAVCPINDPRITAEARFVNVPGLTPAHVTVQYLSAGGTVVASPGAAGFGAIRFVRVRIERFPYQLAIPFVPGAIQTPEFAVTMPRESLGVSREGATPC